MRLRDAVGGLGLVGTLLALGFVLAPESVQSIRPIAVVVDAIPTSHPKVLLLGIGSLIGLGATVLSRSTGARGRDAVGPLVRRPPEGVYSTARTNPGSGFDRRVERGDDEPTVRETLRQTAVETLVRQAGVDRQQALEAVHTGVWTHDPVVAAFLGRPRQPLLARLRRWLGPDAERRRRVERTVAEIERVERGDRG